MLDGSTDALPRTAELPPEPGLAESPLAAFGSRLSWLGCLGCVVVTPLLFNPHSARCFEEDKVLLLRSLAVVIAAGLLIRAMGGSGLRKHGAARALRSRLVALAFALMGACLLATILSVAPQVSFWGAYTRSQGAYVWLAYGVVFLAVVCLARRVAQVEQVISAVLLASLPCALYALLQHFGLDPVDWRARPAALERVSGTAGNPIFLAAYMIMVIPLTLSRAIRKAGAVSGAGAAVSAGRKRASWMLRVAYSALLGLQLLTVAFTRSRGPLLGLFAGLCFFGMILALRRRRRRAALGVGGVIFAGVIALVGLNLYSARGGAKQVAPWLGRLGELFSPRGTGRARLVYWQGAMQLLRSQPERALWGYGPDTIFLAYAPFHSPELTHLEGTEAYLDRLHNETLDSLVTTGVLGAAAQLLLFVLFFRQVLGRLGLAGAGRQGTVFWTTALGGGAAGALGPFLIEGTFRLSGLGLPAGLAGGMAVYLVWLALGRGAGPVRQSRTEADPGGDLLLVGLFSAVMAHFIETQLCIATVATRLHWWLYVGLAAAMLWRSAGADEGKAGSPGGPASGEDAEVLPAAWIGMAACTSLAMMVLLFGLYQTSLGWRAQAPALALLVGSTWVGGMIASAGDAGGRLRRRLTAFAVRTAVAFLLFAGVYVPWTSWRPRAAVKLVRFAAQQSHATSVLYAAIFLVLIASAWQGAGGRSCAGGGGRLRKLRWAVGLGLLLLAAASIVRTNLDAARADCFAKQAQVYQQSGQWDAAAVLYQEAIRLQPRQDEYRAGRAMALAAKACQQGAGPAADRLLAEATSLLERALRRSPLDFRHPRAMAKVYQFWASLSGGDVERLARAEMADAFYCQAAARIPNYVPIRNEWSGLWLEHAQLPRARAIAQEALRVDDRWGATRLLLARIHVAAGDDQAALRELEEATDGQNVPAAAWAEKARVLGHLGDLKAAIDCARSAVAGEPGNCGYRKNLALLYQRDGQIGPALEEARAAYGSAPADEQESLGRLIRELTDAQPPGP